MPVFTVMTWNIENLFRPTANANQAERQHYQQKLALLAGVINQHDPDVVALQEVGGEEPLHDLQQELGGEYSTRAISAFPDHRGIRVAYLSKHPIDRPEDIVDFPIGPALDIHGLTGSGDSIPINRMSRGALHIRVTANGLSVDLITAHLKSKLLSFPRPGGNTSFSPRDENERAQVAGIALLRREAEAVTLRIRINALLENNSETPLVLLGDFNDVQDAQTTLILNGPPSSEIGTGGFNRPDKGDGVRLFNLAVCIPPEHRYSRIEQGRKELIDHILVSEELLPFDADRKRRLPVVDSHIDFEDELDSVTNDPNSRALKVAPDHAPVTAQFNF